MTKVHFLILFACGIAVAPPARGQGGRREAPAWEKAMARVHARFHGHAGTFAQFGDSITESLAYWTPLHYERKNAPPEMERAYRRVEGSMRPECWRDWRGPDYGSQGSQTIEWAREHVDDWLKRLDPEVALIMFGTNDLPSLSVDDYRRTLREVVRKCLDNGTVVILSTIPPRHGFVEKSRAFADAARSVARELSVPLLNFHAQILRRRPDDWDGAADSFRAFEGYDVPTLIGRDGVHPSAPARFQNDYSAEALRSHGYGLRSFLSLLAYARVLEVIGSAPPASVASKGSTVRAQPPRVAASPAPSGEVLVVHDPEGLARAARVVRPGGTILLADGLYRMTRTLVLATDGVTLRGRSGRRERVVLDGGGTLGEMITIRACSDATVADLAIRNVRWNGIKLDTDTGIQRATIRNCILHNIWQRGVKGVKVPAEGGEAARPHGCRVESCLFVNDRPKHFGDDPADTEKTFGGNYIGGIDAMDARGWTIRGNVFLGIRGRTGEARGAIFLWIDCRDCFIERNVIVDCDSGICLGNSFKPDGLDAHCTNVMVRNNFVTRAHENGILADYTRGCFILHNTVHDPGSRHGRLIRIVHDNEGLVVANNLLDGPPPRVESTSAIILKDNASGDQKGAFVAPEDGDLRLTAAATAAIDRAAPRPEVTTDIDGNPRGSAPDLGAHEFRAVRPTTTPRPSPR